MHKITYIFRRLRQMNYKKMFQRAKEISADSPKSGIRIFFDMIYCGFKYQAGYEDYYFFRFDRLNREQRKTYVTRGISYQIVNTFNQKDFRKYCDNKKLFLETYKDFIGREFIDVSESGKEEFRKWVENKKDFIIKPLSESSGVGIEKITVADYADFNALYDKVKKSESILAEETVQQNEIMASLHPLSVNTVRIVTFFDEANDIVHPIFACMRIGNGKVIDNLNNGGMTTKLDTKTGRVLYPAETLDHTKYEIHPITKKSIIDFTVPYWDEVISLVTRAAHVIPQMAYVGWDVAISVKGPILIEANSFPGHGLIQMPSMLENKEGILPYYEKIMHRKFHK